MNRRSNQMWTGTVLRRSAGLMALTLAVLLTGLAPAFADSNLITNGDFSAGNTGFSSAYTYGNVTNPGTYVIGTNPSTANGAFSDWGNYGAPTAGGNMMIINGGNYSSQEFWDQTVTVAPNTTYTFSFDVAQVDADAGGAGSLANLDVFFNSLSGGTTGSINAFTPANGGSWATYQFTWNSGSATTLDISLSDLNTNTDWNDFAITDLSLTGQSSPIVSTPEPTGGLLVGLGLGLVGLSACGRKRMNTSEL